MNSLKEAMSRESKRPVIEPSALESVHRRARRRELRRRVSAGLVAAAVAALSALLVVAVWPVTEDEARRRASATAAPWEGLWPDSSADGAAEGQRAVQAGRQTWRSDGIDTVLRFGTQYLGWTKVISLHEGIEGLKGFEEVAVLEDPEFPGPATVGITPCSLEERVDKACDGALVTVERLLTGPAVWEVTGYELVTLDKVAYLSREAASDVLREFLQRRIDGSGAEEYLSSAAEAAFGPAGQLDLYSSYASYAISSLERSTPSSFTAIAGLAFEDGTVRPETLFIRVKDGRALVIWGYRGDDGP